MLAALWRATPTRTLSSQTHFCTLFSFFLLFAFLLWIILSFLYCSCFNFYYMVSASVQFVSLNSLYIVFECWCWRCKFSTYYYSVIACYLCYLYIFYYWWAQEHLLYFVFALCDGFYSQILFGPNICCSYFSEEDFFSLKGEQGYYYFLFYKRFFFL